MQGSEPPGKSRDGLKAAKLRKWGRTPGRMADMVEYAKITVHGWLLRMREEGLERRHDRKSPGRPRRLSGGQIRELDGHPAPEPDGRRPWARILDGQGGRRGYLGRVRGRVRPRRGAQADRQDELFGQEGAAGP